jgi:hypothetical protein
MTFFVAEAYAVRGRIRKGKDFDTLSKGSGWAVSSRGLPPFYEGMTESREVVRYPISRKVLGAGESYVVFTTLR